MCHDGTKPDSRHLLVLALYDASVQAAALYERAVNAEETPERHALLADALVRAERRDEALWHYEQAADLYEDMQNKVTAVNSTALYQFAIWQDDGVWPATTWRAAVLLLPFLLAPGYFVGEL